MLKGAGVTLAMCLKVEGIKDLNTWGYSDAEIFEGLLFHKQALTDQSPEALEQEKDRLLAHHPSLSPYVPLVFPDIKPVGAPTHQSASPSSHHERTGPAKTSPAKKAPTTGGGGKPHHSCNITTKSPWTSGTSSRWWW